MGKEACHLCRHVYSLVCGRHVARRSLEVHHGFGSYSLGIHCAGRSGRAAVEKAEGMVPGDGQYKVVCSLAADSDLFTGQRQLCFFRASSFTDGLHSYRQMFADFNPEIFWNGSLLSLGLNGIELVITVIVLLVLLAVSMLQEKNPSGTDFRLCPLVSGGYFCISHCLV